MTTLTFKEFCKDMQITEQQALFLVKDLSIKKANDIQVSMNDNMNYDVNWNNGNNVTTFNFEQINALL